MWEILHTARLLAQFCDFSHIPAVVHTFSTGLFHNLLKNRAVRRRIDKKGSLCITGFLFCINANYLFFIASSTATATATVAPTIGLLPMPMRPIISTCAGTEEEPANCASECILPMVSVMP